MATLDFFTIAGIVCTVGVIAIMFTLCKFKGGCNKPV